MQDLTPPHPPLSDCAGKRKMSRGYEGGGKAAINSRLVISSLQLQRIEGLRIVMTMTMTTAPPPNETVFDYQLKPGAEPKGSSRAPCLSWLKILHVSPN